MLLLVTIQVLALQERCDLNGLEVPTVFQGTCTWLEACPPHLKRFRLLCGFEPFIEKQCHMPPWYGRDIYIAISLHVLRDSPISGAWRCGLSTWRTQVVFC